MQNRLLRTSVRIVKAVAGAIEALQPALERFGSTCSHCRLEDAVGADSQVSMAVVQAQANHGIVPCLPRVRAIYPDGNRVAASTT